jgi:16S rRNA (adenine1518-N6/adenine1519-N6)-dimethyltransferase
MPKNSLGQHWLNDRLILEAIADSVPLTQSGTVLEIGPGLGTLTSSLLRRAGTVIAVEYDPDLAAKLPGQFPGKNLTVVHADILEYDFSILPKGYTVVANVPYYITQKIVERFLKADNQPDNIVLLVQKEVAEKYAAQPGDMTHIALKLQHQYDVQLGTRVPKEYFTPPPLVDSQVIVCKKRHVSKKVQSNDRSFYRIAEVGFSSPRKKLRTTLSGGLGMSKDDIEHLCSESGFDADCRPSELSVSQWEQLAEAYGTR